MRRIGFTGLSTLALLALACAHRPVARAPAPEVVWPGPPAAPRAHLAFLVPDPDAAPPRAAWWRRALDTVAGIERSAEDRRTFERPFGVVARGPDDFFVADPDAAAVLEVRRGTEPERIACRGREWAAPMALALDDAGELWVADAGAGEVVRVGADRRCAAIGSGALERPTGVAVRGDRVFVADPPNHAVVVFSREGRAIASLAGQGSDDARLAFPSSVALASDGTLLVVDTLNFRIARFAPDGKWLGSFGAPGDVDGGFVRPKGIAVGPDGRVYVSDAQRDVVLVFSPQDVFEYALGASGADRGHFSHPAGVAVTGGTLLVADSYGRRVQAFTLLGGRT